MRRSRFPARLIQLAIAVAIAGALVPIPFAPRPPSMAEASAATRTGTRTRPVSPDAFLDTDLRAFSRAAEESYRAGRYREAADRYLDLLRLDINDAASLYNLACCEALLGNEERAARNVARAFRAGFSDLDAVHRDPDFDEVRGKGVFRAVEDSLDRAVAREDSLRGTPVWIEGPSAQRIRVRVPAGFDPAKQWPLVLGLHGFGDTPEQFVQLADRVNGGAFIFAAAQAPYPADTGSRPGFAWYLADDPSLQVRTREASLAYIAAVIRVLRERYPVSRVYLLGFSQGAFTAINFGQHHPELVDAVIAFGGWVEPPALGPVVPRHPGSSPAPPPPVFLGHGRDDRAVPLSMGTRARDLLGERGVRVVFREFPGGHTVDPIVLQEALDWALARP